MIRLVLAGGIEPPLVRESAESPPLLRVMHNMQQPWALFRH